MTFPENVLKRIATPLRHHTVEIDGAGAGSLFPRKEYVSQSKGQAGELEAQAELARLSSTNPNIRYRVGFVFKGQGLSDPDGNNYSHGQDHILPGTRSDGRLHLPADR